MSHRQSHIDDKIGRFYLKSTKPVKRSGRKKEPGSSSSRLNRDQREGISLPYRQSHSHSTSHTQGSSRDCPTPPPNVPTPPPAASYEEAAEETRARRVRFASPPHDYEQVHYTTSQQDEDRSSSRKEEQSESSNDNGNRSSSSREEQGTSSGDKNHHISPGKQKQDTSKGYEHRSSSTKQERVTSSKRPDTHTSSNKHKHHSLPKKKEHHISSSKLGQSSSSSSKREKSTSYKKPEYRASTGRHSSSSKVATSSREPKGGGERVSPKVVPNPTAVDVTFPIQQARARGKEIIKSLQFTINVVLLYEWCMDGDDFHTLPKRFKSKFKVIPVKRDSMGKYQPIEDTKSKWGVKTKYDPKYKTYLATILIRVPPELAKLPRGQLNAAYRRFFVEPRNERLKDLHEIPFKDNPDLRKCAMLFHVKSGDHKPRIFDDYLLEDAVIRVGSG
ncbi:hypothetical protein GQX73_g165 [Xylaria multiplex]|uniref:Uncharacterized protein n=1 Tax=Xylaria multiplex TaxID=323545 RepID=A0A7C8J425_9PEZI|nr:hypothetical protein GQX73_g165 [Xylaria multiplex]